MSTVLEIAVTRWAEVLKENERDKQYLEPQQREQWEAFEQKTTPKLKEIIENYNGEELAQSDSDWLNGLMSAIEKAQRVSEDELVQKKAARDAAEVQRLEDERQAKLAEERKQKELQSTKSSLLGKLNF